MTITVAETIAAPTDATVDFASLPAGRVILVWGTKADSSGTAMTLPGTIDRLILNLYPAILPGSSNQCTIAGVDVTPSSAPLSYTIGNTGGTYATGGFEIDGLSTDINYLHNATSDQAVATDVTVGSHSVTLTNGAVWTENEGFLFGTLQANQAFTAPVVTGASIAMHNTSKLAFSRILTAADKNTVPSVSISWATDVRWVAQMFLLKPPNTAPSNPTSVNLQFARAVLDIVKADADALESNAYVVEPIIDNYELEAGAGNTTALRSQYYKMRSALAELRAMPGLVQTEVDLLQGSTSTPVYKMVRDSTSPFVDPVTDMANGATLSANTWIGLRSIASIAVGSTTEVDWWLDVPTSAPATQDRTETDGPDFSIPIVPANMVDGGHSITARVVIRDSGGTATNVFNLAYTFSTTGAGANTPPTVGAGTDTTVTVGTDVSLNFTASDPDGLNEATAGWTQVSGPAALSPPPPTGSRLWTPRPTVAGVYVVQARIADTKGALGTDDKTITANATGGGAGNMAKTRLGVFARTGYGGDGAGPRPTIVSGSPGAVTFVESYFEPDRGGVDTFLVREIIAPQTWSSWRAGFTNYLPDYQGLANRSEATILQLACPMLTGDEFTSSYSSMRDAYRRGASGAFETSTMWGHARSKLEQYGFGTTYTVYIDPMSEYDLGDYPNVGQAGRMNFGRMEDGTKCAYRFYQYLTQTLNPAKVKFGACRISGGGTTTYRNINNQVETFGGVYPQGTNMSEALCYLLDQAHAPVSSWWGWIGNNFYDRSETTANIGALAKWNDGIAAATKWGLQMAIEEWGLTVIGNPNPSGVNNPNGTADGGSGSAAGQFLLRMKGYMDARPASGPGSLAFGTYFMGLAECDLYRYFPLAKAYFMSSAVFGA